MIGLEVRNVIGELCRSNSMNWRKLATRSSGGGGLGGRGMERRQHPWNRAFGNVKSCPPAQRRTGACDGDTDEDCWPATNIYQRSIRHPSRPFVLIRFHSRHNKTLLQDAFEAALEFSL